MTASSFIKLSPIGPGAEGLTRRPPYSKEGLETEPPVHSSHLYVNDEDRGIKIGVWECTPHTSKMLPFPVNEFMILLEGSVTMLEQDGKSTTVQAGEAFVVPKGVVCQWKQAEPVRKFFAIQGGGPDQSRGRSGQPRSVTKTSSRETQEACTDAIAGLPFGETSTIYVDTTGSYALGTWEGVTDRTQPVISLFYHVLRIEAGSLSLSDEGGASETLQAGDTVLVSPGKPIWWKGSENLRVLACSIKDDGMTALQDAAA